MDDVDVSNMYTLHMDQTLFNADHDGAITYILRAYDSQGLQDCLIWGDGDLLALAYFDYQNTGSLAHGDLSDITSPNCRFK